MRILWVATKVPWPPVDGGRLVSQLTLEALAARGHELTVLAPAGDAAPSPAALASSRVAGCRLEAVAGRPRPRLLEALRTPFARRPWTIRRHAVPEMARAARRLARERSFDLVHVEQIQALAAAENLPGDPPVVLRMQNVESDLWFSLARRRPLLAPFLAVEARRLATHEASCVRTVRRTVTLTSEDAERLRELAGEGAAIEAVPAPFPGRLEPGPGQLVGEPPLVIFGSAGWWPNRDGARWFVDRVWPEVFRAHPEARLHLFGSVDEGRPGVVPHAAPTDSAEALPPGSALLVPLFVASGVRMKILEAWARGVPVIASPAAARGLEATPDQQLLLAETPEDWVRAIGRLAGDRRSMTESARSHLVARHAPDRVAERLEGVYREALG